MPLPSDTVPAAPTPIDSESKPTKPTKPTAPTAPTVKRTRVSAAWITAIVGALVLVVLLVFILQNQTRATVNFFGMSGSLPLGVALLFAAIVGALLVALLGTARILQLRRGMRRMKTSRHRAEQRRM